MLSYRLISGDNLLYPRSFCPACKSHIKWYDLIPLISWFILQGKCRACIAPISPLYSFIEAITAVIFSLFALSGILFRTPIYCLFISALIVTIRTDLEFMLISRFVTIFLIPISFMLCGFNLLPLTLLQSTTGAATAFLFLSSVRYIFFLVTKKIGLGQGDIELLAFIGSFLGISGWWLTLLIGSLLGSIGGIGYYLMHPQPKDTKIPFGPFLASGAIMYILFKEHLITLFLV